MSGATQSIEGRNGFGMTFVGVACAKKGDGKPT